MCEGRQQLANKLGNAKFEKSNKGAISFSSHWLAKQVTKLFLALDICWPNDGAQKGRNFELDKQALTSQHCHAILLIFIG